MEEVSFPCSVAKTPVYHQGPAHAPIWLNLCMPLLGLPAGCGTSLRNRARQQLQSLRVIVAERAKSAATLIALASDEIVMSDTSELGPIDPQIAIPTPTGLTMYPAQSFLDGLRRIKDETQQAGLLNPVYYPILSNLNPALIDFCVKAIERSQKFAQRWLERYMCQQDPEKARQIASQLCDAQRYASHGAVIDRNEAQNLGLRVHYVPPTDQLWEAVWRLHTYYEVFVRRHQIPKIYETSRVSIS